MKILRQGVSGSDAAQNPVVGGVYHAAVDGAEIDFSGRFGFMAESLADNVYRDVEVSCESRP